MTSVQSVSVPLSQSPGDADPSHLAKIGQTILWKVRVVKPKKELGVQMAGERTEELEGNRVLVVVLEQEQIGRAAFTLWVMDDLDRRLRQHGDLPKYAHSRACQQSVAKIRLPEAVRIRPAVVIAQGQRHRPAVAIGQPPEEGHVPPLQRAGGRVERGIGASVAVVEAQAELSQQRDRVSPV